MKDDNMNLLFSHRKWAVTLLLSICSSLHANAGEPQQWSSFRDGGHSYYSGKLPVHWTPTEGVLWQKETIGYGQSTPVIRKEQIYLASVLGDMKETCCVTCLSLATGEQLWQHRFEASTRSESNYMHSRAAPTPVVCQRGVYVFFESGDLVALSHAGEEFWHRDLAAAYGPFKNNHGLGSSPAQSENLIFLNIEHGGPSVLIAIEKESGKVHWLSERPSGSSWTSPITVEHSGNTLVVVSSGGELTAYDSETGTQIWSLDGLEGNSVPSPTAVGDYLLVGARLPEFGNTSKASQSNLCLRLNDQNYEVAWRASKMFCDYASPVTTQGCVYFLNKSGVLTCTDLKTGKVHYTKRLGVTCWATPLVTDEHVFFFGKNGETCILKAGPEYEVVARNLLWNLSEPPLPEMYTEFHGSEHTTESSQKNPAAGDPQKNSPPRTSRMLAMMMKGDADQDGNLTREELPESFQPRMAQLDLNSDGVLDQSELQKMMEEFSKRREGSREEARDPILYGVAAADGVIVIRTGTRLYAIGQSNSAEKE